MDVKSTFLYGTIEEEVYVCQPPGFEDPQFPDKVYKVEKALYDLHQAPRAWYETLSTYLLENGFRRGTIDKTLFIKKDKGDILLVQVYVDDIIFGSTKKSLYVEFEQIMHKRFQMSSMRELAFFLGLQMKQKDDGIFISQDKYVADILKKFDFTTVKTTSTPIETSKALLKDDEAKDVDVHLYKSMIGSLMYLTASRLDMMFVLVQGIHHLTWKLSLIVIMLEIALTGNPQQDVVNFLAKDETVYKEWEDIIERDVTTASSLVVEQDSGNINRTQSMATLNESFLQGTGSGSGPRFNTLRSGEDSMKLMELMELCTKLSERILDNKNKKSDLKPKESTGFEEIIDFLNASYDQYALTVNPTIYTTCIEQLWASAKAKIVNGERQIQALVDKKKVIITETSIRSDLKLDDTEGIDCLPTASIFAELERIRAKTTAWNEFSSIMASAIIFFLDKQVKGMTKHKGVYVTPSHTKKVFANMKRPCKGFSGRITPLFSTVMVQATDNMGADSATPTYSHSTPIISQPSSSKPQKKRLRMKQRKDNGPTEPVTVKAYVSTPSYDPPQSGEDSIQLSELMNLCTSLQEKVLDLEKAKTAQANEITSLKKRVKQLEKRRKSRPSGLRRLRKGRKIEDLDTDAEVTLVNKTREMNDDNLMFDTVSAAETASVEISDELTLAQTLIEIKTAKPKPVTTAATTVTSVKDKGKGKMVEPKKPLKKKDQISLDEEMARNLEAHMQAELIEEERLARQKEEEANIALIESWDNTQAMIDADFELAQRLQA
ncbi:putative ribonuclease H-like domain-containing protein [Tanacetum coccineum]